MFKTLITLGRSRSHDLAQAVSDANALPILRQQIRDSAAGVQSARRALALVMAHAARERMTLERIGTQITDLETRTLDALALDREDLAAEGAAAIARLEGEQKATQAALNSYTAEIATLQTHLTEAERRLRELDRGSHIAAAVAKSQSLRGVMNTGVTSSLNEAEATLSRLKDRQQVAEFSETSLSAMTSCQSAEAVSARMAAAGCGPALETDATAVLARLRSRQN
ncbi:PspA/IM30 family protein [Xinfangfangia sp. D13-10-4-6]|uniref:PspA/IM30 family protein n=1 Tax=Pseudogemmobacter hezensis TaxID=2737662 RepID=UPI00155406F8|nr:PspA/IM30 family protein [Pseudogemmobacter hezensis]NPD15554.1 PspA/IM30 family protein [Pseudogemmobacter hezensis]